jgi:hypothetical protein
MTAAERKRRAVELAERIEALADDKIIELIVGLIDLGQERQKAADGWPAKQGGGSTSVN